MNNKEIINNDDKQKAWSYYEPSTKIFKFPCRGRYHEFDLSKVLYIGPIDKDIFEWIRPKKSGSCWFDLAIKDIGLIRIYIFKPDDFFNNENELDYYTYSVYRGMIIIWKELLNISNK